MQRKRLVFGHGTTNARDEAAWLLSHACRLAPSHLVADTSRVLRKEEVDRADALLGKRISERIPAAYVIGEAWLQGVRFKVDERVIVPRSFIAEILGDRDLEWLLPKRPRRILDLCSGSGCLGILAARRFPYSAVDLADLSSEALEVARANVRHHRLGRQIQLFETDLYEGLPRRRYDFILSNPPYVTDSAMRTLPAEYRAEPRLALAGGRNGLTLIDRIVHQALARLSPRGVLLLEIGHNRRAMERKFPSIPFTWIEVSAGDGYLCAISRFELEAALGDR